MLPPVFTPIGIAFAQRDFEATNTDFPDLSYRITYKSPACGKVVPHEARMRIMKCVE